MVPSIGFPAGERSGSLKVCAVFGLAMILTVITGHKISDDIDDSNL